MADMMVFPETVEEFMNQYKITDTEQIYTNGAELVPIFRMKQWFEHKTEQKKGRWKDHVQDGWIYVKCPECNAVQDVKSNFCPNCGADLRERVRIINGL
jgi:ribosomal protein S27E